MKTTLDNTWTGLSSGAKTILERVDINRRNLELVVGENVQIPYFQEQLTKDIVSEIQIFEKSPENEGFFKTELKGNTFNILFLKGAFD